MGDNKSFTNQEVSMEERENKKTDAIKKEYKTPLFEKEEGMKFTEEIWEEFNGGNWCFGCSNCNCN
jgi:hypothetical protein